MDLRLLVGLGGFVVAFLLWCLVFVLCACGCRVCFLVGLFTVNSVVVVLFFALLWFTG